MNTPSAHFLIVDDAEGGFNVCDTRTGLPVAWRNELPSAARIASTLNADYPIGTPAPAHDTVVHQVVMERIGGEPERPLDQLEEAILERMVPESIGGPLDSGLWRPRYGEEAI